jgi:hypothetical protein
MIIRRSGYNILENLVKNTKCPFCKGRSGEYGRRKSALSVQRSAKKNRVYTSRVFPDTDGITYCEVRAVFLDIDNISNPPTH